MQKREYVRPALFLIQFILLFLSFFSLSFAQNNQNNLPPVGLWGELSVRFYCTIAVITNLDENQMCTSDTFLKSLSGGPIEIEAIPNTNKNASTTIINNYIVSSSTPNNFANNNTNVIYIPGPSWTSRQF